MNLRNVADVDNEADVEADAPPVVTVNPVRVPYLATNAGLSGPNIALIFREPQRVPPLRRVGGSGALAARQVRSREGLWLDGVCLRAEDPVEAVITLIGSGAERVVDPRRWLMDRRQTTGDDQFIAAVYDRQRRARFTAVVVLLSLALLLCMRWVSSQTQGWWPLPIAIASVAAIFGAPLWANRRARRLAEQARAMSKVQRH
ncbi:MAG: hypothetical protein JO246_12890 [Frankiaceae bacterium]|nr:hypothetical protein [Frankiaceae bacterium]